MLRRILFAAACGTASLVLVSFVEASQAWVRFTGSDTLAVPPGLEVVSSESTGVAIQEDVYGVTRTDTTVEAESYQLLTVPGHFHTAEVGKPKVPSVRVLVAVPDSVDLSVSVTGSDHLTLDNYNIYPVPETIFEEDSLGIWWEKEIFTKDTTCYSTDSFYPGTLAEIRDIFYLRSQRVVELSLYPIQFNPVQKLVKAYFYLRVELSYEGTPFENESGLGLFQRIGETLVLNYGPVPWPYPQIIPQVNYYTNLLDPNNKADYLMIVGDDMFDDPDLCSLAYWRAPHNLLDVAVVKVEDIYAQFPHPDHDVSIWRFTEYVYDNWQARHMPDGHLGYCLLVGDVEYVPTHIGEGTREPAIDRWFACVSGSDDYPDFMIGRFPVDPGTSELHVLAGKTLDYEQHPAEIPDEWRRRGLLLEGSLGVVPPPDLGECAGWFTSVGYDAVMVQRRLLGGSARDSTLKYLNLGDIIAMYFGHGGPNVWVLYFYCEDAAALSNGLRLPAIFSYACDTGRFQKNGDCLGECFLKNPDGGAIGFYGASDVCGCGAFRLGPHCLSAIFWKRQWILGEAVMYSILCVPDYPQYNLLGDPALDLGDYTAYPDLPDLGVCWKDISVPVYPSAGDDLPVSALIWNIGAMPATGIAVQFFDATSDPATLIGETTIPLLTPRGTAHDTATAQILWETSTFPAGDFGVRSIRVWVDKADLIEESWEGNNIAHAAKHIFFYPNQEGWPVEVGGAVVSSPAIGDLDDLVDGLEVVVGCDDGKVYAWHSDGSPVDGEWPVETVGALHHASPALGDIDGDGKQEVVIASGNTIYAWNGDGSPAAGWPQTPAADPVRCSPALGDIDSDDELEVVVRSVPTFAGNPFVYAYNGDGSLLWVPPREIIGNYASSPAIADIQTAAAGLEIAIGTRVMSAPSEFYVLRSDGGDASGWPVGELPFVTTDPAVGNLQGGSNPDIVAAAGSKVYGWDASATALGGWPVSAASPVSSSPALGDIDGDGFVDVVHGCDDGRVYAWDRYGNPFLDEWPVETDGEVRSSPALGDIDGDGLLEVVVGSNDNWVYAWNGDGSAVSGCWPMLTLGAVESSPAIADLDGDGDIEVIVGSNDGHVFVWDLDGTCQPFQKEWSMFHRDMQRTGFYPPE